jgi:hypothetical protein
MSIRSEERKARFGSATARRTAVEISARSRTSSLPGSSGGKSVAIRFDIRRPVGEAQRIQQTQPLRPENLGGFS